VLSKHDRLLYLNEFIKGFAEQLENTIDYDDYDPLRTRRLVRAAGHMLARMVEGDTECLE
jgi:hypothetical protein